MLDDDEENNSTMTAKNTMTKVARIDLLYL